ncbi:tetratricopeptide repeat protein [Entomobacter blattae]|nr:tetratricopeptide repeat protein [Entomobacter blattae]
MQHNNVSRHSLLEQAEQALYDGNAELAEECFKEFARFFPQKGEGWCGLAWLALQAGQNEMAVALASRAVERDPQSAYYIVLGQALERVGHVQEAEAAFVLATTDDPQNAEAFFSYGLFLFAQGRVSEAEKMLRHAVNLAPQEKRYCQGLARFYLDTHQVAPALEIWEHAVKRFPEDVSLQQEYATLLGALGRTQEALEGLHRVVKLLPEDAAALSNLGAGLFAANLHEEARNVLERSLQIKPNSPEALSNLGLVFMAQGYLPEAGMMFERAAKLAPGDEKILLNYATLLTDMGQKPKATQIYTHILERFKETENPIAHQAQFNLSTITLSEGKMAQGWSGFDARRFLLGSAPQSVPLPEWDGSADETATILIIPEQGLGDFIQFLRYIPYASKRVRLIVEVPSALLGLVRSSTALKAQLWKSCQFIEQGSYRYGATARVNLLSLPYVLKRFSVPDFFPYLGNAKALGQEWDSGMGGYSASRVSRRSMRLRQRLRVGIVWAGSSTYRFDRRRSIAFEQFIPLLKEQNAVEWWSLQYGVGADFFAQHAPDVAIKPLQSRTMAQTAEIMTGLDLIISVDTALVHLAGAMGLPTWLLNRFGGDWRWSAPFWNADGSSVWYSSLRHFTQMTYQPPEKAWTELLKTLSNSLTERVGNF